MFDTETTGLAGGTGTYERGNLVSHSTQVQPEPITVDPPPFVFKQPASFTVENARRNAMSAVASGNALRTRICALPLPLLPEHSRK